MAFSFVYWLGFAGAAAVGGLEGPFCQKPQTDEIAVLQGVIRQSVLKT